MDNDPSSDARGLLRLKYLNKAIIRHPRKDRRVHKFKGLLPVVYVVHMRLIITRSRVLALIFVNKIFVIGKSLTTITKNFLLEIIQLYGIS